MHEYYYTYVSYDKQQAAEFAMSSSVNLWFNGLLGWEKIAAECVTNVQSAMSITH